MASARAIYAACHYILHVRSFASCCEPVYGTITNPDKSVAIFPNQCCRNRDRGLCEGNVGSKGSFTTTGWSKVITKGVQILGIHLGYMLVVYSSLVVYIPHLAIQNAWCLACSLQRDPNNRASIDFGNFRILDSRDEAAVQRELVKKCRQSLLLCSSQANLLTINGKPERVSISPEIYISRDRYIKK